MKRTVFTTLSFLILGLTMAACSGAASGQNTPGQQAGASVKEVNISNFAFNPATLTVTVGTTVKWTNQDQMDHTVTADDKSFDSGQLAQGKSFSFTFTKEGTYTYHCSNHPSMLGKIIVSK